MGSFQNQNLRLIAHQPLGSSITLKWALDLWCLRNR